MISPDSTSVITVDVLLGSTLRTGLILHSGHIILVTSFFIVMNKHQKHSRITIIWQNPYLNLGCLFMTLEWSFSGTGSDGNAVNMTGKSADVLRKQSDGSWLFVIDNPWGTD
jgi:hypothetical protein